VVDFGATNASDAQRQIDVQTKDGWEFVSTIVGDSKGLGGQALLLFRKGL
jgi:hypothetical protein